MSNILRLPITPKQTNSTHKRVPITVCYEPSTGKWSWEIQIITTTTFKQYSDSERNAYRDAKKYIDKQGLGK